MSADSLHILVELSSSDTRIGAVNDALDLAHLAGALGVSFSFCGRLDDRMKALAAVRGIRVVGGQSRMISRWGLPLYVANVMTWIVRLGRLRPDVVHLNYSGYGPSLALAARLCGIPVVSRAGGEYIPRNRSNRWIDAYVANCEPHARSLLGSPLADRVVVAGDLFRRDRILEPTTLARPLPTGRDGRVRFLFLGQLVERKGLTTLVEAFAEAEVDADLLLVGGDWDEGDYPAEIRRLVDRLGLRDRVFLENHRPDVVALLARCDVFVLPSLSDARPRSIIEAMFHGLPVLSTRVGGIPTLVEDGVTGLLVPPGDPRSLAEAIRLCAGSRELRARLGEAGRRRAESEFRPERAAENYVRLYRELSSPRPIRSTALGRL